MAKKIKFIIDEDGTISIDQIGFEGKECSGKINDIIKALGDEKKVSKKPEYFQDNEIKINQKR